MTSSVTYRRAHAGDAEGLARLRFQFRSERAEVVEEEAVFIERCTKWMRPRLASSGWTAWVAEQEGRLLGQVWLQVVEKIPNPVVEAESHGYITNLFVQPQVRSAGVGSALLQLALTHARDAGLDRIVLWPTDRSRSLYVRHGFQEADDVMQLRV
jgi:GNAT superfamily N-acetyltransferase